MLLDNLCRHIAMANESVEFLSILVPIERISILVVGLEHESNEFHACFLEGETRVLEHILS